MNRKPLTKITKQKIKYGTDMADVCTIKNRTPIQKRVQYPSARSRNYLDTKPQDAVSNNLNITIDVGGTNSTFIPSYKEKSNRFYKPDLTSIRENRKLSSVMKKNNRISTGSPNIPFGSKVKDKYPFQSNIDTNSSLANNFMVKRKKKRIPKNTSKEMCKIIKSFKASNTVLNYAQEYQIQNNINLSRKIRMYNSNEPRENYRKPCSKRSNTRIIPSTSRESMSISPKIYKPIENTQRVSPPGLQNSLPRTPLKLRPNGVQLVKKEEVLHLKDQIRSALTTLGPNFMKDLHQRDYISLPELIDSFRDNLLLAKKDATDFAKYLAEQECATSWLANPLSKNICMATIDNKIKEFAEDYEKIDYNLEQFIEEYKHFRDEKRKENILQSLKKLGERQYITPMNLTRAFIDAGYLTDLDKFIIILLRKSSSLHQIDSKVLNEEITEQISKIKPNFMRRITSPKKMTFKGAASKKISKKINIVDKVATKIALKQLRKSQCTNPQQSKKESSIDEGERTKTEVLFTISDTLFGMKKTLSEVCKGYIYDRVIDGVEYQLIKRQSLINAFKNIRINFTTPELCELKSTLNPIFRDYCDLGAFIDVLSTLGIKEDIPVGNKYMDYHTLEPTAIRIFNLINEYMEKNMIGIPKEIFPPKMISVVNCVSKNKKEDLEVIDFIKVRNFLREKEIIRYGEDLDENFKNFLEMDPHHEDLMMMRKFSKALIQIRNSKYFRTFGTQKRIDFNITEEKDVQREKSQNLIGFISKCAEEVNLKDRIDRMMECYRIPSSNTFNPTNPDENLINNKSFNTQKTIEMSTKEEIVPENYKKQNTMQKYLKQEDSLYTSLNSISGSEDLSLCNSKSDVSMKRRRFGIYVTGAKTKPLN
ncbi:unnamed protein product [Moneuplotes crassus]|uniref:Uncharacterized protein n=1 Tax=Euplotes crassus TaxID=5936 RepID=A0AAD1U4T0_EUPCR|nr:unnamed protein product [Moneuplotes crassus]